MRKIISFLLCLLLGLVCLNALADDGNELRFPASLAIIEQEAFMNDASVDRVILHEGIQRIGQRAFAFSSAEAVYLPVSLTSLADDAFEGCANVHLYVYSDSYAHQWCTQHTIPYTVLDAADAPADGPVDSIEERTLDFGSAGYAVLAEDVIHISKPAAALGGGRYTLTTSAALSAGDVVYMSVNGQDEMYKIASVVEHEDGTVTITEDPDIYLAEMYDAIHLDTHLAGGNTLPRSSVNETLTVIDDTFAVEVGPMEWSADLALKIRLKVIYDAKLFGKDYIDVEVYTEYKADCGVYIGADFDTWDSQNPPAIPIYSGPVIIPGINLPCQLSVSIPIHAAFKAGSKASIGHTSKSGFRYTTAGGYEIIDTNDTYATAELTGAVELAVGPEISLNLSLFKDTFVAKIGGQVGIKLSGELVTPSYGGSTEALEPSIHACAVCVDLKESFFGKMRGSCGIKLFKELSIKPADITICEGEIALGVGHCSIVNEAESIYGGKLDFGWMECKNRKYLTTVHTLDMNGQEIGAVPLTITGEKTSTQTAESPAYTYLYNGDYTASAAFESGVVDKPFIVRDGKTTVSIKEESLIIKGVVTSSDGGKVLENASVTLTLPDGTTRSAATNAAGEYEFDTLRAGTYSLHFSAPNHQDKHLTGLQYVHGTTNAVNVELQMQQNINGTVLSENTRLPLAGMTVNLTGTSSCGEDVRLQTVTDENGNWSLYAEPGDYTIQVSGSGYRKETETVTASMFGSGYVSVEILMQKAYTLSFNANGGFGSMDSLTAMEGDKLILPVCTFTPPPGKSFFGWQISGSVYSPGDSYTLTLSDVVAYAIWSDYLYYNGHYYKAYSYVETWYSARSSCSAMGGYLATLTTAEEQAAIYAYLDVIALGNNGFWLGGTDEASEGNWSWITGEAWTYSNWGYRQPDNYDAWTNVSPTGQTDEDYLGIAKGSQSWAQYGAWNDFADNMNGASGIGFICEWDFQPMEQ